MIKKYFTISIIKEARIDENRSPFTPNQIQALTDKFPNLHIPKDIWKIQEKSDIFQFFPNFQISNQLEIWKFGKNRPVFSKFPNLHISKDIWKI